MQPFVRMLARMSNKAYDCIPKTIYQIRYSGIYVSKPKPKERENLIRIFVFLI